MNISIYYEYISIIYEYIYLRQVIIEIQAPKDTKNTLLVVMYSLPPCRKDFPVLAFNQLHFK